MKKLAVLSLLCCFVLSACGGKEIPAANNAVVADNAVVAETAADNEIKMGEVVSEEADSEVPSEEDTIQEAEPEEPAAEEEEPMEVTMYADFTNGCPSTFEPSGDWSNGSMFNVTWRKTSCTFDDQKLQLTIDNDPNGKDIPYSGAELRSKDFYGYGRYEVSMKAIKNDGVVSSFFTYTGPSDNNPWDEIDIEILGKDTTKVQFNYFKNGVGNHEKLYDLGFDASEDFHTYAFEWHKFSIDWFVDGEKVYTARSSIPVTESKIMMNAWCGIGVDSWLKPFDNSNLPLTAEYAWIAYTAFEE